MNELKEALSMVVWEDWLRINQIFWREAIHEFDEAEGVISYPAFLVMKVAEKWREYASRN